MSNCKHCKEEYDRNAVNQAHGNLSSVYSGGYCSARCYTKAVLEPSVLTKPTPTRKPGRPALDGPRKYYSLWLKIEHMNLMPDHKSEYVRAAIKAAMIKDGLIKE